MTDTATTRTIVTFHPEVACDVCGRSLLRGEKAEVFLDAGRQRTVCELCAPRAALEGWRRASGALDGIESSEPRPRGGLLRRLRSNARPERAERRGTQPYEGSAIENIAAATPAAPPSAREQGPAAHAEPVAAVEPHAEMPHAEQLPVERAVETFNASEFPRRIAGVARSLGVPEVSIWSAEHHHEVVRILVAWELSWYRYEVDLTEESPAAKVIGQGSELSDLPREERLANIAVDGSGRLVWTSV